MKAETFVKDFTTASDVRAAARAPRWVVPMVKSLLLLTDAGLVTLSFVVAFYIRHYESIVHLAGSGTLGWSREFKPYAVLLPLIIPIRLLLLRYYDLYRVRGEFSFVDDAARVFKAIAISSLLIVAAAFIYRCRTGFRTFSYSRLVFVLDFLLAFRSIALVRMVFRAGQ